MFQSRFGSFFGSFFAFFKPCFVLILKFFGGGFVLQTSHPKIWWSWYEEIKPFPLLHPPRPGSPTATHFVSHRKVSGALHGRVAAALSRIVLNVATKHSPTPPTSKF